MEDEDLDVFMDEDEDSGDDDGGKLPEDVVEDGDDDDSADGGEELQGVSNLASLSRSCSKVGAGAR